MLKTQLRSKLFPLHARWGEVEDILTGDYFGALDYLPRRPFLAEFITHIAGLNHAIQLPCVEDVDWDGIEFRFWPMISTEDETAEPDVLLISNRWVLVVEVKLGSGLGFEQPWREYRVGQEIARRNGLSKDSVFYLLVTRAHASVANTFTSDQALERDELVSKTMYLRWFQAVSMIETWLRRGAGGHPLAPEHERMLRDLREAMRKRRSIVFSGFSFDHQDDVIKPEKTLFCPPTFQGFLPHCSDRMAKTLTTVFLSRFRGFLVDARPATDSAEGILSITVFSGFVTQTLWVDGASDGFLPVSQFSGFLNEDPHPAVCMDRIFAPSIFCGFLKTATRCRQGRSMLF